MVDGALPDLEQFAEFVDGQQFFYGISPVPPRSEVPLPCWGKPLRSPAPLLTSDSPSIVKLFMVFAVLARHLGLVPAIPARSWFFVGSVRPVAEFLARRALADVRDVAGLRAVWGGTVDSSPFAWTTACSPPEPWAWCSSRPRHVASGERATPSVAAPSGFPCNIFVHVRILAILWHVPDFVGLGWGRALRC